jgi:hypothetical protein
LFAPLVALALSAAPQFQSVNLDGFTHVQQKEDFCGEADVEMFLRREGRDVSQDDVFNASGLDPLRGRGVVTDELSRALRAYGIEPGQVWFKAPSSKEKEHTDAQWAALHADLVAGQPSIVCMHYSDAPKTTEHFRLVTGYDAAKDEVIYQEPAEKDGGNRRMARALFLKLWTFHPAADRVTLIRFRLPKSDPAKSPPRMAQPSPADVAQHVMAMKEAKRLPDGFTLAWEKPFLVVSNEPPAKVKQRAKDVVGWANRLLQKDFFDQTPEHIEEAWLFADARTYEQYSRSLFKTEPDTPYGYYLSSARAMVMNIKPGYGTLTHEMVHPYFHQNWPEGPAWMNEGLGSLFERPSERDGVFIGKPNWRLPGLKSALRANAVQSFKTLVHKTNDAFYGDDTGVNYAQARYLCYWLQEKGVLVKFVRRAQELKAKDATGWQALTEVLGKDPDRFFKDWEKFTLALDADA